MTEQTTSKRAASRRSTENDEDEAAVGRRTVPEVDPGPGVASHSENKGLEHSEGGSTTRDDRLDLGVPMLQGDSSEPVGPEDALGDGPKRGDYTDRVGPPNYLPHRGNDPQRPKAEDRGEKKGRKGGVNSADDS